ncbi:MAG: hypothetical protein E7551_04065 [Ruminococcaceae bacterium]|nr:hypothetical protein [Oscillospiraceae bacterium]
MKKVLSVILALLLVASSMTAMLLTPASAVSVTTPVLTDPNLAKDYTVANGDIVVDPKSSPWQTNEVYDFTDPVETIYGNSGGSIYSWRFGTTDKVGKNIINANGLKPNTTYYFSYVYARDFQIVLDGVKDAEGNYVFEGFTADSGTVVYPEGVTVASLSNDGRIKKVEFYFTTNASTDYDIVLKTCKSWANVNWNWSHVRLSDLMLAEYDNNLAADYEYKEDGTGNIVIPDNAGLVADAANSKTYTVNGGKSFRMKGAATNVEVPIKIKATGLKANTVYNFSWVYANDYKVQAATENTVVYVSDVAEAQNIATTVSGVVTKNISGGQGAVLSSFSFTTLGAGDYEINLVFAKGWMNPADPTNGDWDSTYLSDIRLVEAGQYDNLIADYTMAGGEITYQNNEGIWDKDKYGGSYSGYWWKLPYIHYDSNFAFNINVKAEDIEPNTYYMFSYNCGLNLYTQIDAVKTTGFTVLKDLSGEASSSVILKTGDNIDNCVITLRYARPGYPEADIDPYASAVIANLNLTKHTGTYSVSATTNGNGTCEVSNETAQVGDTVTFTATPKSGENFIGWYNPYGSLLSEDAIFTHTVFDDFSAVAKFTSIGIESAIIMTDKNGNQGNAAISIAGGSSTGKNGLRIYNAITNDLAANNVVEFGAIAIRSEDMSLFEVDDVNVSMIGSKGVGHGVAYRSQVTSVGDKLQSNAILWATLEDSNVFTSYLTGISPEHYDDDYLIRPYAIYIDKNNNEQVVYGDTVSVSIFAVANAIDNQSSDRDDPNAEAAFNHFVMNTEETKAAYELWCQNAGATLGALYNKEA